MDNTNDSKNKLTSINLVAVKPPTFKETYRTGLKWVQWGNDNLYPNYIMALFMGSAINGAIIKSKSKMCIGDGLILNTSNDVIKDSRSQQFINVCNHFGESLSSVYSKCAFDFNLYGGYAIKLNFKRDKSISEITHVDFSRIRLGEYNDAEEIETCWVSSNWARYMSYKEYHPKEYLMYNGSKKQTEAIFYVKPYTSMFDYYPAVPYLNALGDINSDSELTNFYLSQLQQGMFPPIHVEVFTPENDSTKLGRMLEDIKQDYNGTSNAGRAFFSLNDGVNHIAMNPVQNGDQGNQFRQLQANILQNILSGHGVDSPMLVGIKTAGQLGGNNEISNAWESFFSREIKPMQQQLCSTFNSLLSLNGLDTITVANSIPIKFIFSENILTQVLSKNELREALGYELEDQQDINKDTQTTV
mgnify:CR=1 FL=1